MKLLLLIALVITVVGLITCQLIEMANMQPIAHRPEGLPDAAQPNTTNTVNSTGATNGQTLLVITNAEWYVECDLQRSTNLTTWVVIDHLSTWLPEALGASTALSWVDNSVSGSVTFTVGSTLASDVAGAAVKVFRPHWTIAQPPPCAFYRYANLNAWRHEYYTVLVDQSPTP